MRKISIALALAASTATSPAFAAFLITAYTNTGVGMFNADLGSIPAFTAGTADSTATFTYAGTSLNLVNPGPQNTTSAGDLNSQFFNAASISGYSGSGPATGSYQNAGGGFSTLSGFLASSASIAGFAYGSLYVISSDPGVYGGQTLQITHDDGVTVYLNGSTTASGVFTAGPTEAITQSLVLPTNTTSYQIVYGRANGAPSILQTALIGAAVPEPATWAMMISGFGMIGYGMRRRNTLRVTYAA